MEALNLGCIRLTSCGTLVGMNKRHSHTECTHPATKAARAACRRMLLNENTSKVVDLTFSWVLRHRAKGYGNKIELVDFYRIAQEYGIEVFEESLAKKMAREKAEKEGHLDILGESVRPDKDIK